uniref:Uncharacterized protein n=1 Tax=Opuntia streptacantha TaxID=393608 RepID=A0A7C8Z5L0_OPUST
MPGMSQSTNNRGGHCFTGFSRPLLILTKNPWCYGLMEDQGVPQLAMGQHKRLALSWWTAMVASLNSILSLGIKKPTCCSWSLLLELGFLIQIPAPILTTLEMNLLQMMLMNFCKIGSSSFQHIKGMPSTLQGKAMQGNMCRSWLSSFMTGTKTPLSIFSSRAS